MNDAELQTALAARLRSLSRDEPDLTADVRAAQRARLVAMAAVRSVGATAVRTPDAGASRWQRLLAGRADDAPVSRWRTRLTAGLVGAAMSVGALSGLLALAQDAEPGDLLYGLKRGGEETQLALASDEDRGLTLLTFASTRLAELADLTGSEAGAAPASVGGDLPGTGVAASGADAGTVVDVLTTMDDQTIEGTAALTTTAVQAGDEAALDTLAEWTTGQRAGLDALDVPVGAEEAVAASVGLVDEVAARGAALQAVLACPAGAADAGSDRLGVVPGPCLADVPVPTSSATPSTGAGTTVAPGAPTAQAPAPGAPAQPTTTVPGQSGGGAGASTPARTSTQAPAPAPAPAGTTVPALPTPAVTTTVPPLIDVPLLPSTTICVGGLICIGD
ncbi:DUF5667 domain-containing protein [Klenkia terrae]|uniref:DUF5667 domain-containing protein n=1 Tax=Klenkia terrae TaxID=1052259 RepID=A0ABU8E6N9_9ACTN